jgi:hypothetical protein
MVAELAMSTRVLVIDTSYLLELFKVPRFSTEKSVLEIRKRHKEAINEGCRLYVPVPCIFELADHIADVKEGSLRKKIAQNFLETLNSSITEYIPWIITPVEVLNRLPGLCSIFVSQYAPESIGLTDTTIIDEANRLRSKYSGLGYQVHIWTKDSSLKAREPDRENNAYLG